MPRPSSAWAGMFVKSGKGQDFPDREGSPRKTPPKRSLDGAPYGYSLSAATFPRSTVIEAFGRVNVVAELATTVAAAGGLSGSAWLFGPSLIQTYCSLPKVTSITGPEKDAFLF